MRLTEKRDGKVVYIGKLSWVGNCKAGQLSKEAQQEILNALWLMENIVPDQGTKEQEENEMKKHFVFGDSRPHEDAQLYEGEDLE